MHKRGQLLKWLWKKGSIFQAERTACAEVLWQMGAWMFWGSRHRSKNYCCLELSRSKPKYLILVSTCVLSLWIVAPTFSQTSRKMQTTGHYWYLVYMWVHSSKMKNNESGGTVLPLPLYFCLFHLMNTKPSSKAWHIISSRRIPPLILPPQIWGRCPSSVVTLHT